MKFLALLAVLLASSVDAAKITPAGTCANVPEGTYIANPDNCKKFFKCENGKPIPGTCPGSTNYNVVDNVCSTKLTCVNNYKDIVCRNEKDGDKVADPMKCSNFYTCQKQKANSTESTACPRATPKFDSEKKVCVGSSEFECPPEGHCSLIADQIFTRHSNPAKCSGYFLCMNNIAIAGKCLDGYGFNYKLGACDWGHECSVIECDTKNKTPSPGTCSKYHTCKIFEVSKPVSCPAKQHFKASSGKCEDAYSMDVPCEFDRCENMPDGYFIAAPNTQCKSYRYCLKGESSYVETPCSADYPYLNEEYQQCVKVKPQWAICN